VVFLKANTCLHPELAQRDHVLRIPARHARWRRRRRAGTPEAVCLIQREVGLIGKEALDNLIVIGGRPIRRRPDFKEIIVVMGLV